MAAPASKTKPKYSPMLTQYLEYKAQNPDCLVLIQVGDFYEAFFEDAVTLAETLNITLTSRSKSAEEPIPMAGVPLAVVDSYSARMVAAGFSVALVSQVSAPTGKGMVERKLDRMITPGIRLSSTEDDGEVTQIAACTFTRAGLDQGRGASYAFATSEVQTGRIEVFETETVAQFVEQLARSAPAEVIVPAVVDGVSVDGRSALIKLLQRSLPTASIKYRVPGELIGRALDEVKGFATVNPLAKRSVELLVQFVDETLVGTELPFKSVSLVQIGSAMLIDSSTRKNLELLANQRSGDREGSLLSAVDATVSPMGGRLVRQWLTAPLMGVEAIQPRLDAVEALIAETSARAEIREALGYCVDFERVAARIELGVVLPRELAALRDSIDHFPKVREALARLPQTPRLLAALEELLEGVTDLQGLLKEQLVESVPSTTKDGGYMGSGFDEALDEARRARSEGTSWLAALEAREREKTGISSLKIKFNNVLGYFIEVTKANLSKVPESFVKKQSTTNAGRFFTDELKELEEKVLGAAEVQRAREQKLFELLKEQVRVYCDAVRSVAQALAILDCVAGFAENSERNQWVRPELVEERTLHVEQGRHPVIAQLLRHSFVPNDLIMSGTERTAYVVTGPNMGGKSTYLRQNALLVIMAQVGCFVPAKKAIVGIVDRIFARIGASDDLLEGESTFMVEMREASQIIRNASDRSLLLIDEIGRGTATGDGLAIARALLEWIVERSKSRVLFATHFHQLTALESHHDSLGNLRVGVHEGANGVLFTHKIEEGAASRSYGLEVARLAGLPEALVGRARTLMEAGVQEAAIAAAETGGGEPLTPAETGAQLSMFGSVTSDEGALKELEEVKQAQGDLTARFEALCAQVLAQDINSTTPLEALQRLAAIQELCNRELQVVKMK